MSWRKTSFLTPLIFLSFQLFAAETSSCAGLLENKKSLSPLFESTIPLCLRLTGDFEEIHKANAGGNWTGEDRSDSKYWTVGDLTDLEQPARQLKIRTRARGMSSAEDLPFPKLRVEIDSAEALQGTVFKGSRKFRLNTHGNTDPWQKHSAMGRLADERSPYREALAYEIAQAMDLPGPLFRRARILYYDRSLNREFERQALILETDKKISRRLESPISVRFPEINKIPIRLGARFHLFNILIGNEDVGLKLKNEPSVGSENYRPFFNTTVFEAGNGDQFPIVYDFDLASIVTDWEARITPPAASEFKIPDGRIGSLVQRLAHLRSRLSRAEYEQVISDYRTVRENIRETIRRSVVDEEGRDLAFAHVEALDHAITIVARHPMLLKKNVRLFATSKLERGEDLLKPMPLSGGPGTLRPGTMIAVLGRNKKYARVAVMDMNDFLSESTQYVGFIRAQDLVLGFDLPPKMQGQIDERDMMGL